MPSWGDHGRPRAVAKSIEEIRILDNLCRRGRLYEVERWIAEVKPLQAAPEAIPKGTRPKTALQIALETGQHSLASLLLKVGADHLRRFVARLERPEICAPETYHELRRTPRMQERLRAVGLVKKPVTEREKQQVERQRRAEETAKLMRQYDRATLYHQSW